MEPIQVTRWVHVAAGSLALVSAPGAMLTSKGGLAHRRFGKTFFWGMAVVALSAIVLAFWRPVYVLALVALFSFHQAFSGYRVLLRKTPDQKARVLDWAASITVMIVGLALLASGFYYSTGGQPNIVLLVFGGLAVVLSVSEMRRFLTPPSAPDEWLLTHLTKMLAAYIATLTAFSTVTLSFLPFAVRWLWPTALGIPIIFLSRRHYRRRPLPAPPSEPMR